MSTADDGFDLDVRAVLGSVADAYRHMEMPVRRYALVVLLPAVVFAVLATVVLVFVPLPLSVSGPVAGLALLGVGAALGYPKLVRDRKAKEIRERFHLFLTHITVLSMTNIDRVEIFRTLAQEDEYGAIADEMGHIVALVDTFNQSLDDACRMRARRVPSELFGDFLERLAYTVGAGQELGDFLVDEQDTMRQQFTIRYEGDLAKLEVIQELYMSMMLSTTFILVFATVLPLIIGTSPTLLVGGVVGMLAVTQGGFLFLIHTVSPYDPVWFHGEERSPAASIRWWLWGSFVAVLVVLAVVVAIRLGWTPVDPTAIPLALCLAIPTTPLLVPGLKMRREEQRVTERDEGFPAFIRSLGSVESVKRTSSANVLSTLREKDFGALTEDIDALYKRLNTRIDTTRAWRLFAAEAGSYLVQKFGDMYVVGRRMGGDPKQLGQVISKNFTQVLKLREQRSQQTSTFVGIIYGVTAASVFSAFIGLEIAALLTGIAESFDQNQQLMSSLFSPQLYDIPVIEFLLLVVIFLNALLSSLMIRLIDRGHSVNAYTHYVGLVWVGAVVAVVTRELVGSLITV